MDDLKVNFCDKVHLLELCLHLKNLMIHFFQLHNIYIYKILLH